VRYGAEDPRNAAQAIAHSQQSQNKVRASPEKMTQITVLTAPPPTLCEGGGKGQYIPDCKIWNILE